MRANYDALMQKALDGFAREGKRPRLLLHVCCAPCSSAVMERLSQALQVTLYYHNPNIDSAHEHDARAEELRRLQDASRWAEDCVITPYAPQRYRDAVRGLENEPEGGLRCQACFHLRLQDAAQYARAHGYDCFTTTLTISPMKSAALLNQLGEAIGREQGIPFLNSDFKKRGGYQRSAQLSREYGLYRQNYCGCIYSKIERERRQAPDQ